MTPDIDNGGAESTGSYDIRKGAAGYASIMGAVGSLVVPAVILVFTVAHEQARIHPVQLTLVTGLLVLGLLSCVASAFAFAALSGENELTVNLPAAAMHMGVGVILGITSILAAFEVLAYIYLPSSRVLFAAIVAGGGLTGAIYNSLSVVDDWEIRVDNTDKHGSSEWFTSRGQAHKWAMRLATIGGVPVLAGFALFCTHNGVTPSPTAASLFIGTGLFLTMASIIVGTLRTLHPSSGRDVGIRRGEAIATQLVGGGYLFVLMLFLPN
jgi:hypothetical protein